MGLLYTYRWIDRWGSLGFEDVWSLNSFGRLLSRSLAHWFARSPPHNLQLDPPHGRERHARERNRDPRPDVASVPAHERRHGPRVPGLVHADDGAGPTDQEGDEGGDAEREAGAVFPGGPVEGDAAELAEQEVLLEHDGQEDGDPVAHEGEEVFENLKQVVPARDAADELDDDDDDDPEPAGHGFEVAAQGLQVDGRGVGARDVVLDGGEGEDDGAEAAEAAEAAVAREQEGPARRLVGGLPGRRGGDAAAEADPEDVDKGERSEDAEPGCEEGERLRRVRRVVDVEVGARGRPADGDRVLQREEGEPVRGDFAGRAGDRGGGGEGGVEVGPGGADEDEEGDELGDGGPSVEGNGLACDSGEGSRERENCVGVRNAWVV